MKKYILLLITTLLLSNCVNLKDHYGLTLCGNSACKYKDYEGRGSVILDTKYDYDYKKMMSLAVTKATQSCLIGYAVVRDYFPKDEEVFKFHWDTNIQADYILYIRLESFEQLHIEAPFKVTEMRYEKSGPYEIALIYFYVDKKRAISCYDLTKQSY